MTMLSIFEEDNPINEFSPFDEHCYRVKVQGPHVGMGGCGVTLWFDAEDEARAAMESAMHDWPGRKIARLELRTVHVAGPKREHRQFVGFTPLWVRAYNPEAAS